MIAIYAEPNSNSPLHTFSNGEQIVNMFRYYSEGFKAFYYFCKNEFMWRSPNADMIRFDYDTKTGEKINWAKIYEENKRSLRDYSEKEELELVKKLGGIC
jgi:hypothetical protein